MSAAEICRQQHTELYDRLIILMPRWRECQYSINGAEILIVNRYQHIIIRYMSNGIKCIYGFNRTNMWRLPYFHASTDLWEIVVWNRQYTVEYIYSLIETIHAYPVGIEAIN